jgi:hypothetical protein
LMGNSFLICNICVSLYGWHDNTNDYIFS